MLKRLSLFCTLLALICWGNAVAANADKKTTAPAQETLYIQDIIIEILDRPPYETNWHGIAESLMLFKKGDRFQARRLEETIEALKLCRQFQKIHVDSTEAGNKINLIFKLTPFHLIKNIKISGNYPFFEKELTNIMTISIGDVYISEELPEQQKRLTQLFKVGGYIDPQIEVFSELDKKDGYYTINIKVKKGPYYKLDQLEIEGANQISESRLKMKMKTWRQSLLPFGAGRYREKVLKEDLKRLLQFYLKKGFLLV